jgi:AraC family transcriptional regulator
VGAFANTITQIAALQKEFAPALSPTIFNDGARITGRLLNRAWEAYVPGLQDHVIVAMRGGPGETRVKVDGKEIIYPMRRGQISLIPCGRDGTYRSTTAEVSNVVLSPARLLACAEQISDGRPTELVCRTNFDDPKLYAILDLLSAEAELGKASSRLFVEQLLDLACTQLLRAHSAFSLPNATQYRGLVPWQVRKVTAYMRENLDKDIGLQELADLVNLSRFYFCSAFRTATGYTPHEWLTTLRIHEARRLLANPETRISDVALAVGYQTPSAFTAAFRQRQGLTPREFRRLL